MDDATSEETALAYALWDATSTEKLCRPEDLQEMLRQARSVAKWLRVHGATITKLCQTAA